MTKKASSNKVRITLLRSPIGTTFKHKATLNALGLRRIRQSVEQVDTPQLRGMIAKVEHLIKVEAAETGSGKEKKE